MLKVSFKDTPEQPSKIIQIFNGKVTTVTLVGSVPWDLKIFMPLEITRWIVDHPFVDSKWPWPGKIIIKTTGIAKRADGDAYNPILAERIAEARAKIKIYKFMASLLKKVCKAYYKTLYGNTNSMPTMGWGGLFGDMTKYDNLLFKEWEHLNQLLKKAKA